MIIRINPEKSSSFGSITDICCKVMFEMIISGNVLFNTEYKTGKLYRLSIPAINNKRLSIPMNNCPSCNKSIDIQEYRKGYWLIDD